MKLFAYAMLIALSVASAEESAGRKTETTQPPYVGIEAGADYHELYLAQPLKEKWQFHGLIYRTRTEESGYETVGFMGPSYRLFHFKGLEASLGAGLYAGKHQPTGSAGLGEVEYESKWLKGEGVYIQSLSRPEEHGRRDKYLVYYFGPQFPCWGKAREGKATCETGFAQDTVGHNRKLENLRGFRLALPLPKLKCTKGYVKAFTHGTLLWGLEFRP